VLTTSVIACTHYFRDCMHSLLYSLHWLTHSLPAQAHCLSYYTGSLLISFHALTTLLIVRPYCFTDCMHIRNVFKSANASTKPLDAAALRCASITVSLPLLGFLVCDAPKVNYHGSCCIHCSSNFTCLLLICLHTRNALLRFVSFEGRFQSSKYMLKGGVKMFHFLAAHTYWVSLIGSALPSYLCFLRYLYFLRHLYFLDEPILLRQLCFLRYQYHMYDFTGSYSGYFESRGFLYCNCLSYRCLHICDHLFYMYSHIMDFHVLKPHVSPRSLM